MREWKTSALLVCAASCLAGFALVVDGLDTIIPSLARMIAAASMAAIGGAALAISHANGPPDDEDAVD